MDKSDPKWKGKGIAECSLGSEKVCHRKISGPAGVVEEALHRRREREGVLVMTTQEAVHRALMVESEDTDFIDNPAWIKNVKEGYLQLPGYTDLATVNKFPSFARVNLVVALVKSCGHTQSGSPWLHLKILNIFIQLFARVNHVQQRIGYSVGYGASYGLLIKSNESRLIGIEEEFLSNQSGLEYFRGDMSVWCLAVELLFSVWLPL
ncbi:hypothetical protein RHSIM_Rhsim06G0140000 [Rhododendron simsii]|uniref:Uncharacterized protein n=1 Tax=Rhododendron simsii TaxID=118357 RepID=A0A834GU12_RHOSS|nr:hypothetical protein RHSIM_Rhsim06G0140000 [Rhododendron simsii]